MAAKSLKDNLLKVAMARQGSDLAALKRMEDAQNNKNKDEAQASPTSELAESADRANRPSQLTRSVDQAYPVDQVTRQSQMTEPVDQATRDNQMTRSCDRVTRPSQVTRSVNSDTPGFSKLPRREIADSPGQKAVLRYLQANGDHVTSHTVISKETGVPIKTVQRALDKFVASGFVEKTPWREGRQNGIRVKLTESQDRVTRPSHMTWSHDRATWPSQETGTIPPIMKKIDREDLNLSISLEAVLLTWPRLAAAGFGPEQLAQIHANLTETGQTTDRVLQGLHHAEWELEQGTMRDKAGQPVADPCSWVFRSLARTGYYRRPKGYVSPEEQAARDAEAEAKAVTAARQAAEQAQFEAWRDGLSPDELEDAMRGHPGGPKDAWLKRAWKSTRGGGE